jgi:hypothetical protein
LTPYDRKGYARIMSVIANYARLSPAALDQLRSDQNWEALLQMRKVPDAELIDIDKACDGLVWLLSRVPPPPALAAEGSGFVMMKSLGKRLQGDGGEEEPRLEAGYGPACSLSVEQVVEFNAWLRGISVDRLRALYDPQRMSEEAVYPNVWTDEGESALNDYLLPYFRSLQQFFACAADSGQQVLVFFS